MPERTDRKNKAPSKKGSIKKDDELILDQKKRAAYSAMGKLGGLARAKQLAEKGFEVGNKFKVIRKDINKK